MPRGIPGRMICRVADCDKLSRRHGMCPMHHKRWVSNGDPLVTRTSRNPSECQVSDCSGVPVAKALCAFHYGKMRRYGNPLVGGAPKPRGSVIERLWRYVDREGSVPAYAPELGKCWVWTGATSGGYGHVGLSDGGEIPAHRLSYELLVGPIEPGLEIDHLCRVRACCNPAHLEPVTRRTNQIRGFGIAGLNHRKTECPDGHPYDEANTYVWRGGRRCRACQAAAARKYRARNRRSVS